MADIPHHFMTGASPVHPLHFGVWINTAARTLSQSLEQAQLADRLHLDLVSMNDHPYNADLVEMWTLFTHIGAHTERVRLFSDVANLPLRPPQMLAKAAATLDLLTGGRLELGLGAGLSGEAIQAFGGTARTPGEAVDAFAEAVQVMEALWYDDTGKPMVFDGKFYKLGGIQAGPAPAHPIRIWSGAQKPRFLRLTGAMAGGWIPGSIYTPPDMLHPAHALIDEGAQEAGRNPADIRRGYNLWGQVLTEGSRVLPQSRPGVIVGSAEHWAGELTRLATEYRMDMFSLSFTGGDTNGQIHRFAEVVVPRVRAAVGQTAEQMVSA